MNEPERGASMARSASADWLRALGRTAGIRLDSTRTLARVLDEQAEAHGSRPALVGPSESLSYADLAALANRCARWALSLGLKRSDRVALLLENDVVFPAIWIGLGRVGVVTALCNPQVTGEALARNLALVGAQHVLAGTRHYPAVAETLATTGSRVWHVGGNPFGPRDLASELLRFSGSPLTAAEEAAPVTLRDPALLVFTSGTTGLPKAALISHFRVLMWSEWFAGLSDAGPDDRLYNCLPMYHAVGGIVAVGAMLVAGASVIVRNGFSASRFWPDVAASGATIFQYIGELCRYLVNAPPQEAERQHTLRLCCGNGLRADTWARFAARFAPPRILEFYAATEGSFSLFNCEEKVGALGRVPPFLAHRSPVALVRQDGADHEPARGPDGRLIRCAPGEIGEALGRIEADAGDLATRFEGYTNAVDTDRKILRDVFQPGDAWFRTGDLMLRDKQGFFFFVDRIGDTFRWKGENVATAEVAEVAAAVPGVRDATVYGVEVPGTEGRAGMAALVVDADFDLEVFALRIGAVLPRYARPVFLRLARDLASTPTFRPLKTVLQAEGFDPDQITDPLFVAGVGGYAALDSTGYAEILAGRHAL